MTIKDRIFVNAIKGLRFLQLDDGYEVTDTVNEGYHSCRVRVQRKNTNPTVEGPKYFHVQVREER
jgi:hypothetical protein